MRRRMVITLIGGGVVSALWPLRARSADKVYRIVFVVPIGQFVDAKEGDAWKGLVTAFLQGLGELGYVDGKNMKFEFYSAEEGSDKSMKSRREFSRLLPMPSWRPEVAPTKSRTPSSA
jgi:hypothetical protein